MKIFRCSTCKLEETVSLHTFGIDHLHNEMS